MSYSLPRSLPKELTSYDLVKTFAVVFMLVDHLGFYFFPDENWFRVFGRMCVPAWFFLIGYARSRDLGVRMWVGAGVLVCGDMLAGLYVFPLNILGTMIIIRLLIDPLMARALRNTSAFWAVQTMLFILIIPSSMIFEYGTHGVILAIFGYLLRHREELKANKALHKDLLHHYFAFALVSFIGLQTMLFGFTAPEPLALAIGILAVMGALYNFRPMSFPKLTARLPRPLVMLLQLTGRRTLEIYVAHLLLFKALGVITQPERFALFDWNLIYLGEAI